MSSTTLGNKEKIRQLTILSMFIAIIAVMAFVPYLGFITIGPLSLTIIPIPVMIGGVILGRKNGAYLGLAFGVLSLIKGSMSAGIDYLFIFPWVSVLPRFLFGLVVYDVYHLTKKIVKKRIFALALSFFILSLIHSLLVLPMLVVTFPLVLGNASIQNSVGTDYLDYIRGLASFGSSIRWIFAIIISNSVFEALLAGILGSVICDRLIASLNLEKVRA